MPKTKQPIPPIKEIEKTPTGIEGLDQITFGGIPKGRQTLICGNAGSGKTVLAMEFIANGALEFNEPGVFIAFEEKKEDLIANLASMGFDLEDLIRKKLILIEYIQIDPSGYTETGEYDLEGLFIRIESAINQVGAKRIALDTIEVLFSSFLNESVLRSELRRLFGWLKGKQMTTMLTGEQGTDTSLTRHGIEEYVADCVISLTNTLSEDLYTRRLQIIKYRGSYHETNRFPFIIGKTGISILPITALNLQFEVPTEQISTGIPQLDASMGGLGYYEGSSILLSGPSGAGKTIFAGCFAKSVCERKQKCLFLSYEESEGEILRNLLSVGLNFNQTLKQDYFKIISTRPTQWGLERHLGNFIQVINEFEPKAVVIDPINTLLHCGTETQVYSVLTRMIDYLKKRNITLLMTIFSHDEKGLSTIGIPSIIDTWIHLRNSESNGELNREIVIVKSRGMGHSNQVREFSISSKGIAIREPYYGEEGVLTGTARIVREGKDTLEKFDNISALEKLQREIELKKRQIEIQIQSLNAELEFKKREADEEATLIKLKEETSQATKNELTKHRYSGEINKNAKGSHDKKTKK